MFDFPASPSAGQIFAPSGGPQYEFKSPVWKKHQVQAAFARNRVVNGAMLVSQQNVSIAGAVLAYFPVDQWYVSGTVPSPLVFSVQQVASVSPNGSPKRLRYTVTTAAPSLAVNTQVVPFAQKIEGIRTADFGWGGVDARQLILRFGWKSPAGTYTASLRNDALNRYYLKAFTISAGQANTDTSQVLIIPGDIAGVWEVDNNVGILLAFNIAADATKQAAADVWTGGNTTAVTGGSNGVAAVSSVFELFDVGLYLDPYATGRPPKWEALSEGAEMLQCQRYWYIASNTTHAGANSTSLLVRPGAIHPVPMRATPAVTVIGAPLFTGNVNLGLHATTPISANVSSTALLELNLTMAAATMTVGRAFAMYNGILPVGVTPGIGFAVNARM